MSREKPEKDMRKVPITVRLNEEEHEKLKQCAVACGLSAAEFMRQLCKGNAPQPKPEKEFWALLNTLYEVHSAFKKCVPYYQFCRVSLMSFLPLNLTAAFRSRWYARCGQGSSNSLPQVVALHRRGAYPIRPVIRLE